MTPVTRPSTLTPADVAAIKAAVAKLPPLPDSVLAEFALELAAFREQRRAAKRMGDQ
jgi:hypothetical protein